VSAGTDSYSYDAVDQVTAVGYGSGRNVSYTYDASGNRTNVTDSGTASAYVANSLNQYVTANGAVHSYDANGNLQSTSVWNYTYDAQNRLISASNGTTTATLAYDAANRCVARTINGTTTYLYYNGWQLIEEHDGSDNLLASYVHGAGLDELLTRTTGAGTFYYHEDGLGNVVKLTDGTGTVQEGYSYDVFGAVTIRDGSGTLLTASASGNRFLYTGREYLPVLGLYDYRNRVYSPGLGRFLQTDPIRFNAGDINIYRYCGNNPMNGFDPLGQSFLGSVGNFFTGAASGALTGAAVGFVVSGFNPAGAVAGAIAGAVAGGISATVSGLSSSDGDYNGTGSLGSGFVAGGLAALPAGALAAGSGVLTTAAVGAVAGAGGNLITTDAQGIPSLNPDATPSSVAVSAAAGGVFAGLGGIGDEVLDPITSAVLGLGSALTGQDMGDLLNAVHCPNSK
jgi:RHS repeat-associated protein